MTLPARLMAAQCASAIGTNTALAALLFLAAQGSPATLAAVGAARFAPSLLAPLVAGWLDRWDRRRAHIALCLAQAVVCLLGALSLLLWGPTPAVLVMVTVSWSCLLAFDTTVFAALLSTLAGPASLSRASVLSKLATVSGAALAVLVLGWSPWTWMALNAATFALPLLAVRGLAAVGEGSARARSRSGGWRRLYVELTREPQRRAPVIASMIYLTLAYQPLVLFAALREDPGSYGAVSAAFSLASGVTLWVMPRFHPGPRSLLAALAVCALAVPLLSAGPVVAVAAAATWGAAVNVLLHAGTMVIGSVDEAVRARAISVWRFGFDGSSAVVAPLLVLALAHWSGAHVLLSVVASALAAVALLRSSSSQPPVQEPPCQLGAEVPASKRVEPTKT